MNTYTVKVTECHYFYGVEADDLEESKQIIAELGVSGYHDTETDDYRSYIEAEEEVNDY